MCGIAAIFSYHASSAPVDAAELLRIRDAMVARGPDGAGEWHSPDRRVGLAHRRLSIIDLSSAGAQPMADVGRTVVVVFNGEIYNYRELRSGLEGRGCRFQSDSDTEVLIHLYREKGPAMVDELRGMYAFAIWDVQRKGLFVARDPFGIKPLYYSDDGKAIRIASQVKALLAGGRINHAPDPAGHVGFFLWGHMPDPFTLHRGVRALPAGASMWVDEQGVNAPRTFCSVRDLLAAAEHAARADSRPMSGDDLRAALLDSVRHHLIADVPVGVFLSSGLDSTTLAALASECGGRLNTVTLGFEEYRGKPNDEVPLAEQVARQYEARHQTIWVRGQDFQHEAAALMRAMDQPTIDGVNTYFVSKAARQAGLKVAISGLGGDEIFAGYPSFRGVPAAVRRLSAFASLPAVGRGFRRLSAPLLKRLTSPKYAGLLEYGGRFSGAYLLRRGMFMPWELPELLDADMVREGWEKLQPLARLEETVAGLQHDRLKVSALELNWYMRHQLLRDTDWASMAHSLEVRVPLVDIALLRNLGPSLAHPDAPGKGDLARTPSRPLPDAVLHRRKTGFSVPVREWLQNSGPENAASPMRGLRGWARHIYDLFNPQSLVDGTRTPGGAQRRPMAPASAVAAAS